MTGEFGHDATGAERLLSKRSVCIEGAFGIVEQGAGREGFTDSANVTKRAGPQVPPNERSPGEGTERFTGQRVLLTTDRDCLQPRDCTMPYRTEILALLMTRTHARRPEEHRAGGSGAIAGMQRACLGSPGGEGRKSTFL